MQRLLFLVAASALVLGEVREAHARGARHHRRFRADRPSSRCDCPNPISPQVCPKPIEPIDHPVVPGPRPEFDLLSLRDPVVNRDQLGWDAVFCMSKFSDLAYSDEAAAKEQLAQWGLKSEAIAIGSMLAFVAWDDEIVVIAFRGTNPSELADWIVNLTFSPFLLDEGRVHQGWYSAYKSLEPAILEAIPADEQYSRKLWVTGHSLGGALAVVCNYSLIDRGMTVTSTVTFGQPMVSDARLAGFLGSHATGRYVRVVNENDVVPKLPPWTYVHFGKLAWFRGETVVVRGRQYASMPSQAMLSNRQFPPGQRRLTDAEFLRLKRTLAAHRDEVDERHGVAAAAAEYGDVGGMLPMIEDHGIDHYVEKSRNEMLRSRAIRSLR
jgi:triacylglycerol lipase